MLTLERNEANPSSFNTKARNSGSKSAMREATRSNLILMGLLSS